MSGTDDELVTALESILKKPQLPSQTRMWPSVIQLRAPLSLTILFMYNTNKQVFRGRKQCSSYEHNEVRGRSRMISGDGGARGFVLSAY
jgi:hypothetical protein